MLSTWALIVCSLSPACFSACSKPSRSGWFAPCIACTRCSSVSAWSASVMQPLSCRSDVLLPPVSSGCQDEFAILVFLTLLYWIHRCDRHSLTNRLVNRLQHHAQPHLQTRTR